MDQVDECPVQGRGRGVCASQKQVNDHLDQVLLTECGDRVIQGLLREGRISSGSKGFFLSFFKKSFI